MEKLKEIFSPQKKDTGESTETISAKETETEPVRPLESVAPFSQSNRHDEESASHNHSQVTLHQGSEHREKTGCPGSARDPREVNEQPAKDRMHAKLNEHPDRHPLVTTTTTTTHTHQKDVTSTATMNPVSETYTTTTSYKKEDA